MLSSGKEQTGDVLHVDGAVENNSDKSEIPDKIEFRSHVKHFFDVTHSAPSITNQLQALPQAISSVLSVSVPDPFFVRVLFRHSNLYR